MGLRDRLGNVTNHAAVGFDPDVCEGCPQRGEGECAVCGQVNCEHEACGLCGCPTVSGYPMDLLGMPPDDCLRLEEHERRG